MAMLKVQIWRPDTHPDHIVEIEWEYNRDTGREHRCVSVHCPDGTKIHRDTHGADVANDHYKKILAENTVKNEAYQLIVDFLPPRMKKPVLDSDGDVVLDGAGQPMLTVKNKHRPTFNPLGSGRFGFIVPAIEEAIHRDLATKLAQEFGDTVVLLKPDSQARSR